MIILLLWLFGLKIQIKLQIWLIAPSCQWVCFFSPPPKWLAAGHDDVSDDVTLSLRIPYSSSISEMINTFTMSAYKVGLKLNPNEQDPRVPVLSWSTCAYTIQSIGMHTPVRHADWFEFMLIGFGSVCMQSASWWMKISHCLEVYLADR